MTKIELRVRNFGYVITVNVIIMYRNFQKSYGTNPFLLV